MLVALSGVATSLHAEIAMDKIAAVVNGDVILESDIKKQKTACYEAAFEFASWGYPAWKMATEKEILDELIVCASWNREAAKKGIKIDDKNWTHQLNR